MQENIDILRSLNYELVKNLGLFKRRANMAFSQRHILYHIDNHPGLSIRELAALLYVDHSTMSRNIKKMEQDGWVEIYQDETDKIRKIIALSPEGSKLLTEATESINQTIGQALNLLTKEEVEAIIENVRKYNHALEQR